MEVTPIRFAEVAGLRIAWQQFGSGPDCVVIPPLVGNVELVWEHEMYRRVLEFQGSHLRITHFDKRGIGLSDRWDGSPTLDDRISDIVAVMDAAGIDRAHILGASEGGLMAQLFAASHPERVDRLVLANSLVCRPRRPTATDRAERWRRIIADWGVNARELVEWFSPSNASNESFVRWFERLQRMAATRAEFERQLDNVSALTDHPDDFLADIKAPTLVANSLGDQVVDPNYGDDLASRIDGAERLVLSNDDHFFFLSEEWLESMTATIEFLTCQRVKARTERRFAAVVFTDIVGSTAQTSALGDRVWRSALDEHDRIAWALADQYGATIVKSTGDGLLIRVDSPHHAVAMSRDLRSRLAEVGLQIRAGIHCGEIEIRPNQDITGIAVNLAARVEQAAPDDFIYVSSTVRDIMLGGQERFEDRGEHVLKGIDGAWRLYRLAI